MIPLASVDEDELTVIQPCLEVHVDQQWDVIAAGSIFFW